jgi:hypothetical protein
MQSRYLHLQIHFPEYVGQQRQKLHQRLPVKINDILKKSEHTRITHNSGGGFSLHRLRFNPWWCIWTGFSLVLFLFLLCYHHYITANHLLRCAIPLTRQHITTSSVSSVGRSIFVTRHLAGNWVRKSKNTVLIQLWHEHNCPWRFHSKCLQFCSMWRRVWNYGRLGTALYCTSITYSWHPTPTSLLWNTKHVGIYHFHSFVFYVMTPCCLDFNPEDVSRKHW